MSAQVLDANADDEDDHVISWAPEDCGWDDKDKNNDSWTDTYRTRVPGGWLYRTEVLRKVVLEDCAQSVRRSTIVAVSLAFVPDPR